MKTGTNGNGKIAGAGKGKGRGNLDTLATDVETALGRTPVGVPGPTAEKNAGQVREIKIPKAEAVLQELPVYAPPESSLVTHRFPHGVLLEMLLGKDETKRVKRVLKARDPETEFRLALYVVERKKRQLVTTRTADIKTELLRAAQSGTEKARLAAEAEVARLIEREERLVRSLDLADRERYAFCVPAKMYKDAFRGAQKFIDGITDQYVKQCLHVFGDFGDWCEIICAEPPTMREDIVKISDKYGNKTPQFRYRPEFFDWSMLLTVRHLERFITTEQVGALAQYAGLTCGIGENRPEKSGGTNGLFNVGERPKKA